MDQNHLNNFERRPTKDHSCEVWSESNQWFRRRYCFKIVDGQTWRRRQQRWRRRQTVSDHNSSPWAFGSGELTRVMVLVVCTSSDDAFCFYDVSWKYLEWISSYSADRIAWRTAKQTDRQPMQKQYVSIPVRGRHSSLYVYEVSWKYLERFSSYRGDTKLPLSNF